MQVKGDAEGREEDAPPPQVVDNPEQWYKKEESTVNYKANVTTY